MNQPLLSPKDWAHREFAFAPLGDKRRNRRLLNIAQKLSANPDGTLPQAFPDWAELKAAYRFFSSGVTFEAILRPHLERTLSRCQAAGEYLIIEDTTLLDYSQRQSTEDLGYIGDGKGRGFELHSALATRVEGWTGDDRPEGMLVGLLGQSCTAPRPAPDGESRRERLSRPRKSQRWAEVFKSVGGPPAGCRWVYIADRESDCYETIEICQQHGVDFIIRACQNRRLADEQGRLFAVLEQAPVLGLSPVELRARPGESARTAVVEIRATRVALDGLWRPGGWTKPLKEITVLEIREVDPPPGTKEPLLWRLLTSLECGNLAQARRVIGRYTARWWIEEYHKALKTGAGVEHSQLERAYRLEPLIAVLAVVAVRLLSTKMLARSRPESFEAVESIGPQVVELLERKFGKPKRGWTNQSLLVSVARVGGFIGRKGDGMPGWQTIWRGWHRLMWMCEGLELLNDCQ